MLSGVSACRDQLLVATSVLEPVPLCVRQATTADASSILELQAAVDPALQVRTLAAEPSEQCSMMRLAASQMGKLLSSRSCTCSSAALWQHPIPTSRVHVGAPAERRRACSTAGLKHILLRG